MSTHSPERVGLVFGSVVSAPEFKPHRLSPGRQHKIDIRIYNTRRSVWINCHSQPPSPTLRRQSAPDIESRIIPRNRGDMISNTSVYCVLLPVRWRLERTEIDFMVFFVELINFFFFSFHIELI